MRRSSRYIQNKNYYRYLAIVKNKLCEKNATPKRYKNVIESHRIGSDIAIYSSGDERHKF